MESRGMTRDLAKHGGLGMTISAEVRKRLKEVARDLTKLVAEEKKQPGHVFTFAELEVDSIEVTGNCQERQHVQLSG
jgi:hypothetical protein